MTIATLLISLAIGLGALLLFLAGFVILKTALFSPNQSKGKPRDIANIDGRSVAERLGLAVQFPTISFLEPEKFDKNAFLGLHQLLKTLYPQVMQWGRKNIEQHAAFQAMWLQYDHVLPHSRGGNNDLDNIVITCAPCNFGRMDRLLEEVGLQDPRNREPVRSNWDGLERLLLR